ncbi:FAD-binding and (Fe-S)-binding domain-containing protein [Cryptosporangium aurantiacum]|uniref:FAD/FMN-containing dehydrogenase n=1 Tax=Cryptosporangium aurantiacum TaxID=134849 RepID=A0A1M7RPF2_9ACTN|nr:FAD-binding and (Fe-S)-binding domain-containing protein [Cryptosporangium aurantiacum]SHN47982.1 FAD/FMN-containing dehydrogenase [Cryptosporangium aurantiacum]
MTTISEGVDAGRLERRLRAEIAGDVAFDAGARALYSADASNHRRVPAGVVLPRNVDDVLATLAICREDGVPVTMRGGGTTIAGNAIGPGVVLDTSRYLNRILDVDIAGRAAVVEPGLVLDVLRRRIAPDGLDFGPDPSTHSRCTIGGMLGNDACGSHSIAWGTTSDNTDALDVVLADGTRLNLGPTKKDEWARLASQPTREGRLYADLKNLVDGNLALIRTTFGRFSRQISGYPLHRLLPEQHGHLARALVGTEGTCAVVLGATLHLNRAPRHRALVVLGYADAIAAAAAAPAIIPLKPLTIEGIDQALVDALLMRGRKPAPLPTGHAWLLVEVGGDSPAEAADAAAKLAKAAPGAPRVVTDAAEMRSFWRIREEGAGLATRMADGSEAWPGWEDSAVPPERLADYLREFADLTDEYGYQGVTYGHFGEGCVHVRLDFDLVSVTGRDRYQSFLHRAAQLILKHGGSPSGEHGDGIARSALLADVYSPEAVSLMGEFKRALDPQKALNPGVIVDPPAVNEMIRIAYTPKLLPVNGFSYAEDGGEFDRAVRRCVGVGKCRNDHTPGGVMCPSYQATGDEKHSTRGRSRLLLEMLRGEVITDGWQSDEVAEALDGCFSCKGCLTDCPVNVDMATYKSEFLYQRYKGKLRPAVHYAMGFLPVALRGAALAPKLANAITAYQPAATLMKKVAGIAQERSVPRFATGGTFKQRLRRKFGGKTRSAAEPGRKEVLLWPDTFTQFFDPQIGEAAVEVLAAAGFVVRVPKGELCCGLTWVSTGQLDVARAVARRTLDALEPHLDADIPIVGLEPSCLANFKHDLPALLPDDPRAKKLASLSITLAGLLERDAPDWTPPQTDRPAITQIHCHQHAVLGDKADRSLAAQAGVDLTVLDSGCCGVAGNFGFEAGHYEMAQAAGERVLLPAVRAASPETIVLADGFSCRTQIRQNTERDAHHLAEVLAGRLRRARQESGE